MSDINTNDSDELEALFDSVSATTSQATSTEVNPAREEIKEWVGQEKVFQKVGEMTRHLHNTLTDSGYDQLAEKAASILPDTKDRLSYVANLAETAACRVLNATDIIGPIQDKLEEDSVALGKKWDAVFSGQCSLEDFQILAAETRTFLKYGVPAGISSTGAQLTEIMMAQDFQDLTGQVIRKVIAVAQDLESQLMSVLIDTMPDDKRNDESVNSLLNGPVINAEGRDDVVASQAQVDDLLDSLGF